MGAGLSFIHVGNTVGSFSSLSINAHMACGVVKQQVWCWGSNLEGQLGNGVASEAISPAPALVDTGGPVASVSVGHLFACALITDGSVKCWGHGAYGKLGIGHEENVGDQPMEMGNRLIGVQLGEPATQIALKREHTCVLLKSGKVACWGRGGPRLGQGHDNSYANTPDELTPPEVPLGTGSVATFVGVGDGHSCAVLGGPLKCWGTNYAGILGIGSTEPKGSSLNELGINLPVVQITPTLGSDPVVAVEAGTLHTCALLRSGGVKCWGDSANGRLAQPILAPLLGRIADAPDELSSLPTIDFGARTTVRSLATGNNHTCVLLSTGAVKCWGLNEYGQLGLGHTAPVGALATDLGAAMKAVPLE
jgi:alpha-tubulin suppressor-like RCC1 family protein